MDYLEKTPSLGKINKRLKKHLLVLNLNRKGNECRKPSHAMQLKLHEATPTMKLKLLSLIAEVNVIVRDLRNRSDHRRSKTFPIPPHMNQLLTETVLFYWDCIDLSNQVSAKNDITNTGRVKDWADKVASAKFLHPLSSQRSTSKTSSRVRSISSSAVTSTPFKDPRATPVSDGPRASSPTNDAASESQECDSYIQGSDQSECQAMPNPLSKAVT